MPKAPQGLYTGTNRLVPINAKGIRYKATGEFRNPRKGEFFLSGAIIEAYEAWHDMTMPYWIAVKVQIKPCPRCGGTGEVEV